MAAASPCQFEFSILLHGMENLPGGLGGGFSCLGENLASECRFRPLRLRSVFKPVIARSGVAPRRSNPAGSPRRGARLAMTNRD